MYENIISLENLFSAWEEFLKGKRKRKDVQEFSENLSSNIYNLHLDLVDKTYSHGGYQAFNISDPKPRNIHKATVRDRLLHHAVYRILYPYFDKKFISDSYSCRLKKGTHRAMDRFEIFAGKVSKNHTRTAWVLKCDIRKFFASIDHQTLFTILKKYIKDDDTLWLLDEIIESFHTSIPYDRANRCNGLPLGNLTSQLLVNIYMNEFDQFIKHRLKIKYYVRYADDFTMIYHSKPELVALIPRIKHFLKNNLKLTLHQDKTFIQTYASGVDFLGWIHFPDHRVLRTTTRRRMLKNLSISEVDRVEARRASYLGMLGHGDTRKFKNKIGNLY